jgi:hypothetical protein
MGRYAFNCAGRKVQMGEESPKDHGVSNKGRIRSQEEYERRRAVKLCFKCGGSGHLRKDHREGCKKEVYGVSESWSEFVKMQFKICSESLQHSGVANVKCGVIRGKEFYLQDVLLNDQKGNIISERKFLEKGGTVEVRGNHKKFYFKSRLILEAEFNGCDYETSLEVRAVEEEVKLVYDVRVLRMIGDTIEEKVQREADTSFITCMESEQAKPDLSIIATEARG